MTIALWIIAIAEIIRLVQNTIQLLMMGRRQYDKYMDKATDAFVKSMNRTDDAFMHDLVRIICEEQK